MAIRRAGAWSLLTAAGLALAAAFAGTGAVQAQIAVSADDGKQVRPGDAEPAGVPDDVTVLDLGGPRPRILGRVAASGSLIGPPESVAVAPGARFALVTGGQKADPDHPSAPAPDDAVSVIDLSRPTEPKLVQVAHAGPGAAGVSLTPSARLALVASSGEDAISVFEVAGGRLAAAGKVAMPAGCRPTDVAISPDGRRGAVVCQKADELVMLSIAGVKVSPAGEPARTGRQPYGAVFSRDGRYIYNTNLGGALDAPEPAAHTPVAGTVSAVEVATGRLAGSTEVGRTPEHVTLSPDGRWLEVTVGAGAPTSPAAADFAIHTGLVKVFGVDGPRLTPVAQAQTGHWCQGAAWSRDAHTLVVQCATERELEVFRFDGHDLRRDKVADLKLRARPGAIATALGR